MQKFRLWDGTHGKMVYDGFFIGGDGRMYFNCDPKGVDMSGKTRIFSHPKENHFTLLQNTGLTDKSGKDIYEGDIVKGNIMDYEGNHEVIFYDGCFSVKADDNYYPCLCEGCPEDSLEIIGNKFSNPELLEA